MLMPLEFKSSQHAFETKLTSLRYLEYVSRSVFLQTIPDGTGGERAALHWEWYAYQPLTIPLFPFYFVSHLDHLLI